MQLNYHLFLFSTLKFY